MNEFELIARYFSRPTRERAGVGDDCALIDAGATTFAITVDMMLAGRHFAVDADPEALGHKALAVNLSDLAAAGAEPRCFFLALALPRADDAWLAPFARGLFALADAHQCELVGGDTTRVPRVDRSDGPVTICITAFGEVPREFVRTRAGARVGDDVWVSGWLGDAALALAAQTEAVAGHAGLAAARQRLDRPEPRVELGKRLRGIASACIDVSDGLLGDLGHILERSGAAAVVRCDDVPRSPALRAQSIDLQLRCALAGGDDYELLFTAPPACRAAVERAAAACVPPLPVTRIGSIEAGTGLTIVDGSGAPIAVAARPFDHFAR